MLNFETRQVCRKYYFKLVGVEDKRFIGPHIALQFLVQFVTLCLISPLFCRNGIVHFDKLTKTATVENLFGIVSTVSIHFPPIHTCTAVRAYAMMMVKSFLLVL